MRIALDARTVYSAQRRGTGKNLLDLYDHVARLRPRWRIIAYHRTPDPLPAQMAGQQTQPRFIEMIGDRLDAWGRWRLPLAAWRDGADVMHCPANNCPSWMTVPAVVTIHDLIPLDLAAARDPMLARRFEQSVTCACAKAAQIVCPSFYTAARLTRQFGADPQRITVIPWAPDSSMRAVEPEAWPAVMARYGVSRPFVLHLGAAAPRKNTRRVLQVWSEVEPSIRKRHHLLVVGLDPSFGNRMRQWAHQLEIEDSVTLCGFAPPEDLPTLMSAADVLAYPSLSEGFALPLLDAWVAGTAVLCADATSLPEVAEDAAFLVDPADTDAIARSLEYLLSSPQVRADLIQRGRRRVRNFSWQKTAELFVDVIEQAASQTADGALRERMEMPCGLQNRISM